MRLRKACEHDHHDAHVIWDGEEPTDDTCLGGEFLADDALVIEKVNGEWPQWAVDGLSDATSNEVWIYADFLDALAVREGAE